MTARSAASETRPGTAIAVILRCAAALVAIYALTVGVGSLVALALTAAGWARAEAAALASMLGYLLYLIVLLWAVHERWTVRLWLVIGGGAAVTNLLARSTPWGLGLLG